MPSLKFAHTTAAAALALLSAGYAYLPGSAAAQNFSVVPLIDKFAPTDRNPEEAFVVENNTDEPMLLNLKVMTRAVGANEREVNDDTADFGVFPGQTMLQPRQTQVVRLQWRGESNPDRELTYRVIIDQEPIKSSPTQQPVHSLKMAVHFVAPVYVAPANVAPNLSVVSANALNDAQARRYLQFVVANNGKAHALIDDPIVTVSAGNVTKTLTEDQLPGVSGQNVLGGSQRTFRIAWPEGLPNEPPKVDFRFTPVQ